MQGEVVAWDGDQQESSDVAKGEQHGEPLRKRKDSKSFDLKNLTKDCERDRQREKWVQTSRNVQIKDEQLFQSNPFIILNDVQ